MRIVFLNRKPRPDNYSVEFLFRRIFEGLPDSVSRSWKVSPYFSNGIIKRARMLLWARRSQEDINHITGDINFVCLLLDGKKTVLTIHDCEFLAGKKGLRRVLLKWLWLDWPVRHCKFITTVSEASKREIVNTTGCKPEKVRVVYNFVSNKFEPAQDSNRSGTFQILHIGTKKNKNLENLVRAIKDMDCSLSIVGRLSATQMELLQLHRIDYANHYDLSFDEMVALYQSSDMLAFVSLEEGFGLPILEAQRCGVPVITSTTSCLPEIAGEGAILVDPFKVPEIRAGIIELMKNTELREDLKQKGFRNVRRFTRERTIEGYLKLYEEMGLYA